MLNFFPEKNACFNASSYLSIIAIVMIALPAHSQNVVFPSDAGVLDVTKAPYNAVPDDGNDDTAAIQAALDEYASDNRIIYLPDGTYLVSDRLDWPSGSGGNNQKRTILQGQSRDGTVIHLADNTSGFQSTNPDDARGVLWTGTGPAQRFRNSIRNLTVNTGSGNPGAAGIQYIANNQGSLRHVRITSDDGQGAIGLDLSYTDEIGPMLVKDLIVEGFDYGIRTYFQTASITFENIHLQNQNVLGWENYGQVVFIRGLESTNSVTVLKNVKDNPSAVTLFDATLTGTSGASNVPAILNQKNMFLRNITTSGYAQAVKHDDKGRGNSSVNGDDVDEWLSHGPGSSYPYDGQYPASLFNSPDKSLGLNIKETPTVPWDALSDWSNPSDFGGAPDDGQDDTGAIQQAIDSGAKTVYLPNGEWTIDGTVKLRGSVRRFIGTEAGVEGSGTIQLESGSAPTVVLERLDMNYSNIDLVHAASRTWVISSVSGGAYSNTGTGDLFLEDVAMDPFVFDNQNVWARQLNQETNTQSSSDAAKVVNDGGKLWVEGLKTERAGTAIKTMGSGQTEVMGGFIYSTGGTKTDPAFVNDESAISLAGVKERNFNGDEFDTWVREIRGGNTRTLTNDELGRSPLYVGYQGSGGNNAPSASFTASPTSGNAPLDVSFDASGSSDTDGSISSYSWDFGDGTSGSGQTPSHTYSSSGTYTAELTVTDDDGATDTATEAIDVSTSGGGGALVSNVSAESGKSYTVTTLSTGTEHFIDRSYTFSSVPSSYDGNTYIQTANDDKGSTSASFLTFDLSEEAKVAVIYDNRLSRPSWLSSGNGWTDTGTDAVGGGYPQDASVYEKTFSAGSVTLNGNEGGSGSSMYGVAAKATGGGGGSNDAPSASFTASPTSGNAPLDVSFDASGSGDTDGSISSYSWDFGDSSSGSGQTPSHTYSSSGTYTAELTVTDDDGATDTATEAIDVSTSGGGGTTKYEAENAQLTNASIDSNHGGYSGSGFINFTSDSGAEVKWTSVDVSSAGSTDLIFRYALSGSSRDVEVAVNGSVVASSATFTGTGAWDSWSKKTINASLSSGSNTVTMTTTGDEGPNLDYLEVAGSGGPITLNPSDDSYVNGESGGTNYDGQSLLTQRDSQNPREEIFLQFSIGSYSSIDSAVVRLYQTGDNDQSQSTTIYARGVDDDSWSEGSITYNNKPSISTGDLSAVSVNGTGSYRRFDVTSHVSAQSDGAVSFQLEADDGNYYTQTFEDTEAGAGHPPELIVYGAGSPSSKQAKEKPTVAKSQAKPKAFSLVGAYPNPVRGQATIRYALPEAMPVRLVVYDMLGRRVRTLVAGERQRAGRKQVHLNADGLPAGAYLYRLTAGKHAATKTFVVVR